MRAARISAAILGALALTHAAPAQAAAAPAGVVTLPGLQYRILSSGPADGAHPSRGDDVTVRYVGQFQDGKVFGSSPDNGAGTEVFPLQKLIPGWIAALQLMRPGDVWMLYVPAYLAYGAPGKPPYIPPDSPLVFRVELVSTALHVETAP